MRLVVLDIESTGLDMRNGDRIIEVAVVEILNGVITERNFHKYINPKKSSHPDALAVHQISDEFLKDKPEFRFIAKELVSFIGDSTIIAHNGVKFDIPFLNLELRGVLFDPLDCPIIDTDLLARRRWPGVRPSLDLLCQKYRIDTRSRDAAHGALIDARLLAKVYLAMTGFGQETMTLEMPQKAPRMTAGGQNAVRAIGPRPTPLPPLLTLEEAEAHKAFIDEMKNSLWRKLEMI